MATCNWPLPDGTKVTFNVHSPQDTFNDVPGIYIFARPAGNQYHAEYVGQADSLRDRLSGHDRWLEAAGRGATTIHAKVVNNQAERDALEKALIAKMQPPLNTQHK